VGFGPGLGCVAWCLVLYRWVWEKGKGTGDRSMWRRGEDNGVHARLFSHMIS
jgi:hypothetical protein